LNEEKKSTETIRYPPWTVFLGRRKRKRKLWFEADVEDGLARRSGVGKRGERKD